MKYQMLVLCVISSALLAADSDRPIVSFDVRVVDEAGMPVKNVPVRGCFTWQGKTRSVTKTTGKLGSAHFESIAEYAEVNCEEVAGYYESWLRLGLDGPENGRWKLKNPNPVLIMRRIVKPVPMWAVQDLEIEMPRIGVASFDLEKRAWVAPDGKGEKPDLVFVLGRKGNEEQGEATLKLTFSRPEDGMFPVPSSSAGGSDFRLPREAPATGYLPERTWSRRWIGGDTPEAYRLGREIADEIRRKLEGNPRPVAYIFRVRTVLNEKGEVVSALYGKLLCANPIDHQSLGGEFWWYPGRKTKTAKIRLTYCLNPDGTRNLEYDVKKNLFKDLDSENMVSRPW